MPASPRKAPCRCPHCGFVQQESVHLISTYCRSCGSHYEVAGEARTARKQDSGWVEKTLHRVLARPPRTVHCYHCDKDHEVSAHARSTLCPSCGTSIEFSNLTFSTNVSRPVDTRGHLHIEPAGFLNSGLIVCGKGFIEGRIAGTLHCEGTLRLATVARLSCRIQTQSLVIEKPARADLVFPMQCREAVVHGQLFGTLNCAGKVRIGKGGVFQGRLNAQAVIVDRGGTLLAESSVQPPPRETPAPARKEMPDDSPAAPADGTQLLSFAY